MAKSAVVKQVQGKVIAKEGDKEVILSAGSIVDDVNNILAVGENSKAILVLPNGTEKVIEPVQTLSKDTVDTLADVSDLQAQILGGDDLTDLEATAAGGPAGGGAGGNGVSLGAAGFDSAGRESNVLGSTSNSVASEINTAGVTPVTTGATSVAAGTPNVATDTPDTTPPTLIVSDIDINTASDSLDYGKAFVSLPSDDDAATATVSYTPVAGENAGKEQSINLVKSANGWSIDGDTPDGVKLVGDKVVFDAGVIKNNTPIKVTATDEVGNETDPVEKEYNWSGQNDDGGLIITLPLSSFGGEVSTNAVVNLFKDAESLKGYADQIANGKFEAKAGDFKFVDGWYVAKDGSALIASESAKPLVLTNDSKSGEYASQDALVLKVDGSELKEGAVVFGANTNDNITVDAVKLKAVYTGVGNDSVVLKNGAEVGTLNSGTGNDSVELQDKSKLTTAELGAGDDSISIKSGSELTNKLEDRDGVTKVLIDGEGSKQKDAGIFVAQGSEVEIKNGGEAKSIEGASTVTVDNAKVTQQIIMSGGDDTLIIQNGANVRGNISTGEGDDTVVVKGSTVDWNIYTDGGNDTVKLDGATIKGNVQTDGGNDEVIVKNMTVTNQINMGSGNDTAIIENTTLKGGSGDIASGTGDDVYIVKGGVKSDGSAGIYSQGGNDTYYMDSSSNSVKSWNFKNKVNYSEQDDSGLKLDVKAGSLNSLNVKDLLNISGEGEGDIKINIAGNNNKVTAENLTSNGWTKSETSGTEGKSTYEASEGGRTFTLELDDKLQH